MTSLSHRLSGIRLRAWESHRDSRRHALELSVGLTATLTAGPGGASEPGCPGRPTVTFTLLKAAAGGSNCHGSSLLELQ